MEFALLANLVKKAIDYGKTLVAAFGKAADADARKTIAWLAGAWAGLSALLGADVLPQLSELVESVLGSIDGWGDATIDSLLTLAAGSSIYDLLKNLGGQSIDVELLETLEIEADEQSS